MQKRDVLSMDLKTDLKADTKNMRETFEYTGLASSVKRWKELLRIM